MVSFFVCLFILIGGYFTYGKFVENTFGPDDRETPAVRINDGVDYVVMPEWKLFLVQLLNIAGLRGYRKLSRTWHEEPDACVLRSAPHYGRYRICGRACRTDCNLD